MIYDDLPIILMEIIHFATLNHKRVSSKFLLLKFHSIPLYKFCQSLSLSPKSPIFSQKPQVGTCFPVRYIITSPGLKNYQDPSFFVAGEDAAGLATTTLVLPNLRDPDFLTLLMFLGRPRSRHWSGYVFSTNLGTSSHLNIYCGNISYVL